MPPPSPTAADGPVLTTGKVAKLCGCAPKTVVNWCDKGELRSWRLPLTADRRIGAADLVAFLEAAGAPVPAPLRHLVAGDPEVILFRCSPAAVAAVGGLGGAAPVRPVASVWQLAQLLARLRKAGAIVCGDEAAVSEAAEVFASVPARWLKVHVRGDDQGAAAGADVVIAAGDAAGLVTAVSRHLLGGAAVTPH